MLTTRDASFGLRSRPMRIAQITPSGHLWFISDVHSEKIEALTEHPHACASLQDSHRYVSISGTVRIVREREKLHELWRARDAAWFEKGIEDPALVALELVPICADLWDRSGARGLQLLFEQTRAIVSNAGDQEISEDHERIEFDD